MKKYLLSDLNFEDMAITLEVILIKLNIESFPSELRHWDGVYITDVSFFKMPCYITQCCANVSLDH